MILRLQGDPNFCNYARSPSYYTDPLKISFHLEKNILTLKAVMKEKSNNLIINI